MGMNFFAVDDRLERLSDLGDILLKLNTVVDWRIFKPLLEEINKKETKGQGRPPYDRLLLFKILILQQLYNIANDNTEYQINDRLSFQRFLGLTVGDKVPDATTIWLFKERLKNSGKIQELFELYTAQLEKAGLITRTGSIVDATFIERPRQHLKEEDKSEDAENTARGRQMDKDAKPAKKRGKSFYGYKDHIKVDATSKLILSYSVTPADRHDGKEAPNVLDEKDNAAYMDACYRGQEMEEAIRKAAPNAVIHIVRKHDGFREPTEELKANNPMIQKIRNRVEHVFGFMVKSMGGKFVRSVGLPRAQTAIGLKHIAYNMRRVCFLLG